MDKLLKPSMPHPYYDSFSDFPVILKSGKNDMKTNLSNNSWDFLCEFVCIFLTILLKTAVCY